MKNKITLFDKVTGKALVIGTEDSFNENLVLMLPNKNGTLALVEDVEQIQTFLQGGQLVASDSEKLGGKALSEIALSDMSNVTLTPEMINSLRGFTGSAGSAGAAGPIGLQGGTGYTGSAGINGYTGSKGVDGTNGYTGSKGTDGLNGTNGIQGYTGSKGADGGSLEPIIDCFSDGSTITLDLS